MRISDWSSSVCSSDLRVIGFDELPHPEDDDELDHEIDGQRDRDSDDVARNGDDLAPLEAEHSDDREEQRDERDRRDLGQEARLVPFVALGAGQYLAGQEAGEERGAEINQDRLGAGPEAAIAHNQTQRGTWRE